MFALKGNYSDGFKSDSNGIDSPKSTSFNPYAFGKQDFTGGSPSPKPTPKSTDKVPEKVAVEKEVPAKIVVEKEIGSANHGSTSQESSPVVVSLASRMVYYFDVF